MDNMLGDHTFITEETFDFDLCSSSDSSGEEDDLSLYWPSPVSHLVGHPVDMNVPNTGEAGLVLQWSPLSAQSMEEITKEANRLASELEKENMGKKSSSYQSNKVSSQHKTATTYTLGNQTEVLCGKQLQHVSNSVSLTKDTAAHNTQTCSSGITAFPMCITSHEPHTLLLKGSTSLRSPRRETYVIKDSPNRSFLPNVDPITPPICEQHNISYENRTENSTPEKVKKGRSCVSQGRPKSQNPGRLINVRSLEINPCAVGRFSAVKTSASHMRASYRPSGISAAKTHLPVPKASGTHALGNTKESGQKGVSCAMRPSTQRGSFLRPPSQFSLHTKSILKPPR